MWTYRIVHTLSEHTDQSLGIAMRALHHVCAYSQGGCSTKVAFPLLNMLLMSGSAYLRH